MQKNDCYKQNVNFLTDWLILERGTVEFRNNILTLLYQKDEKGGEKGQKDTNGPTLLHVARRGGQPSQGLPCRAGQKATAGLGHTQTDKFLRRSQAAGEARLRVKIRHPQAT